MEIALTLVGGLLLIGLPLYLMRGGPSRHNAGDKDPNFSHGPGDVSIGDRGSHHDGGGHAGGGGDS